MSWFVSLHVKLNCVPMHIFIKWPLYEGGPVRQTIVHCGATKRDVLCDQQTENTRVKVSPVDSVGGNNTVGCIYLTRICSADPSNVDFVLNIDLVMNVDLMLNVDFVSNVDLVMKVDFMSNVHFVPNFMSNVDFVSMLISCRTLILFIETDKPAENC